MKIRHIISSLAVGAVLATGLTSCEDIFDTDSDSYRYDNGNKIDTEADALYSTLGILSQLQKIGERYVLLGELRGDLVTVTPDASFSLREISDFEVSADNEYVSTRDYYSVINNCNFALDRIDTEIKVNSERLLLPDYVAILAIRDWTYFQMALNFGAVRYITEPQLSLEDTLEDYPLIGIDDLVPMLIRNLEPYANEELPDNNDPVDGFEMRYCYVQPRLLLGDLYLYNNNYEQAASMYYAYIEETGIVIDYNEGNRWNNTAQDGASMMHNSTYTSARMRIPYTSDLKDYHPDLINLTYNTVPSIVPADWFVEEMATAAYYHTENMNSNVISGVLQGDLRGNIVYRGNKTATPVAFGTLPTGPNSNRCLITKFFHMGTEGSSILSTDNEMFAGSTPRYQREINTFRAPHVYLRFAEAANRAGKPSLAFAVLKCGLNPEVMNDGVTIDPEELADEKPWTNFSVLGLSNYGTAMRGRGLGIRLPGCGYDIPAGLAKEEKIEFVEEEILRELAAETAFEGNRFFDLLRVSRHRADHPAMMIDKISARAENPDQMKARLSSSENWWVK